MMMAIAASTTAASSTADRTGWAAIQEASQFCACVTADVTGDVPAGSSFLVSQ